MTSTHPVDADDLRPDPDALLARVQQQEAQARRGRLKIFFGASAGVGKTYAMLSAAHAARAQGSSLVVGLVETHGRAETEALLAGLPLLALKGVKYRAAPAAALLRRNLLIYGLGGLAVPFVGIKLIHVLVSAFGLV